MKRIFLIALVFCTCLSFTATAQRTTDASFSERTWYGAHVDFGFSGSTNQSYFAFGLAPMFGYKITPSLSVGPRANILYNNYRLRYTSNDVAAVNPVTWGIGIFSRIRIYEGFFAQGEFGYENVIDQIDFGTETVTKIGGANAHIGAGYNRPVSGRVGYEIMLSYDLNLINQYSLDLLSYRIGFTVGLF